MPDPLLADPLELDVNDNPESTNDNDNEYTPTEDEIADLLSIHHDDTD